MLSVEDGELRYYDHRFPLAPGSWREGEDADTAADTGRRLEPGPDAEPGLGRLLVRARHPARFFQELNRLILEEWYDVVRVETLDDSTQAVLGYLLGSRG